MIRLKITPTPIGLTPGFLSKGINLPAMNALMYVGLTSVRQSFLANSTTASQSSAGLVLNCLEPSRRFHISASAPDGPAAPDVFFEHLYYISDYCQCSQI